MTRPDIFFIIGDCIRSANVSERTMPFVTEMADVTVDRYYSTSTWSLPSHASLYTGHNACKHGYTDISGRLSPSDAVLPRTAQDQGYTTSMFSENSVFGAFRGFHHHMDYYDCDIHYKTTSTSYSPTESAAGIAPESVVKGGFAMSPSWATRIAFDVVRRPERLSNARNLVYAARERLADSDQYKHSHHGDRVVEHATSHLTDSSETRHLSFINLFDAHNPHHSQPPEPGAAPLGLDLSRAESRALASISSKEVMLEEIDLPDAVAREFDSWDDVYRRQKDVYEAAIRYVDSLIEQLATDLEKRWDDALVIFLGDHGHMFYEEGLIGHHPWIHPGLIRVPLYISLPCSWEPVDRELSGPISHADLSTVVTRVAQNEITSTDGFVDALDRHDPIVVATDGSSWNKEDMLDKYNNPDVDKLIARRAAVIQDDEMTHYEYQSESNALTRSVYTLSEDARKLHYGPEPIDRTAIDHDGIAAWITGDGEPATEKEPIAPHQ